MHANFVQIPFNHFFNLLTIYYINNSLHLVRKYARIFVRGYYLFRDENSFPREKLEENCELRGTDNVQGQISEHNLRSQIEAIVFLIHQF